MAIDGNFLAFLVPALIAVLAAAVGFPSKSRIQEDPSSAYTGGRKALVVVAAVFSLVMGLALAGLGSTYSRETIVAGINMIQIGGISLIVIAVALLTASVVVGRQIKRAGKGEREQVLEVAAIRPVGPPRRTGAPPPRAGAGPPPRDLPPRDLPPRDLPPRDLPPRDMHPREVPPRRGTPPPRDLPPRPRYPPSDEVPPPPRRVERRPPPRRRPPPE